MFHVRSSIPKQDQYDGQVNVPQCVENITMLVICHYFEKVALHLFAKAVQWHAGLQPL